ncbi:prenyltransferase/squalene oxidase repeat-containing protein [Kitasatospora sp. NPDC088391]|uniref:prenyltransferase/squalene oxidase repeat-containing protein n=1 Tax=Kitasatospora sp. NPDC088391 TaxID=3364074 RepID=UPI003801CF96
MAIDTLDPARLGPLAAARAGLVARLTAATGPNGLLHAPCAGRPWETALTLHLLTATGAAPALGAGPADRLREALARGGADPVQTAAARAALGGPAAGGDPVAELPGTAAPRDLLALRLLLADLGAGPLPGPPDSAAGFGGRGESARQAVETAALRVLHAARSGAARPVGAADRRVLAPAAEPGPPPFADHSLRLLALLALRHCPESLPAVRARAAELGRRAAADGGLPPVTGADVLATAAGGLALAAADAPAATLRPPARALAEHRLPDGGWPSTPGAGQSGVEDTAYAVAFLRAVADRVRSEPLTGALADGERYLLESRNRDGGFPAHPRGDSDPAVTAGAVAALAGNPEHRAAVRDAVRFLAERQLAAPAVERRRSLAEGALLSRAVLAHEALERSGGGAAAQVSALAAQARAQSLGRLLDTQRPDGGWGHTPDRPSDPVSTGYALIALGRHPAGRGPARRALRHLLTHRAPAAPDRTVPGPLPHDVPLLADITALTALNRAAALFPTDLPSPRDHTPPHLP